MKFDGADYRHDIDNLRLLKQHERIRELMKDAKWRTLDQISILTGDPVASISAQLRHLRKPRFGSHKVERRRKKQGLGLYEYRLILNDPVLLPEGEL
jgi:hypothetical protein